MLHKESVAILSSFITLIHKKMVAEVLCRIYTGGTMPEVILKAEKEAIRHGIFQVIGFASEE